ncbi:MAG: putative ribosome biogenesis GTPase RsgA [Bellilinea sp.]|nr:MAG: putative ribosome biogenesis GTPase RsgA [Bellilinea sp.]
MFLHECKNELLGVITKKMNSAFEVTIGHRIIQCRLSSGLKGNRSKPSAKQDSAGSFAGLTVGDEVRVLLTETNEGVITALLPRRSAFGRRAALSMPDKYPHEQVIAANVDQVLAIFSVAQPDPHWNLLDRYLVACEDAGLSATICMTKVDLLEHQNPQLAQEIMPILDDFRRIGYRVIFTSTRTGEGLDDVRRVLRGQVSLVIGKSGVGKSSLLNALQTGKPLKVGNVNPTTGKGRHTTTHLEMFPLEGGGAVIDTPGMREFGLWDIPVETLAEYFPEMRDFLGRCKYGLNCAHDEEPGCAVRKAVLEGMIHPRRYRSYLRLRGVG